MTQTIKNTLSPLAPKAVGVSIAISILMIAAGFIAIAAPLMAGIAIAILVGWLFILGGGAHFAFAWQVRDAGGILWESLIGFLCALAGVYLLFNPLMGLESLTFALGIYLAVKAFLEMILSIQLRPYSASGWLMADGITCLIIALIIWWKWPLGSLWVIGALFGASLLFAGAARLAISMSARRFLED